MEVFSLLKFWRNASPDHTAGGEFFDSDEQATDYADDEESFFDLVISGSDCDRRSNFQHKSSSKPNVNIISGFHSDDDHYQISSTKLDGHKYVKSPTPKSNFFDSSSRRKILPVEASSNSNSNCKPQSPISLLRSAPKFRVFMLGFTKSSSKLDSDKAQTMNTSPNFEVEEVPIISLLSRDNSLRSRLKSERFSDNDSSKRFSKDLVNKYLNLIKPLYVKVSRRSAEKTRFSDQASTATPLASPAATSTFSPRKQPEERQGCRSTVFREVCKHLGKSRSASSAAGVRSAPQATVTARRDDSVLLQQDGIQSAILHCKKSYNSSSSQGCSGLSRSGSAPHGTSTHQNARNSIEEEEKRSSI